MIIFDEKIYAENLIKNGYKNKKYTAFDNIILVKYWKSIGLDESEIRNKLYAFMIDFQDLFSSSNIIGIKINRAIEVGMKYNLLTDVCVEITQGEIDSISTLDNIELRKMMFVFLVVWKFQGKPQRLKITNTDILKMAKVKANNNVFWDYIFGITQSKMLSMVEYKNKSYYNIGVDENGDVVLKIHKFDNLIDYYLSLVEPNKYKECECCQRFILISGKKKYCTACAKEVWNEYNRKKQKEYYYKNKCSV